MWTNVMVVASTLVVGSVVMYWLQTWTANLTQRVQLETAKPTTMKIVEVVVESKKPTMGRDDERVSTAIGFEVQAPLRAPFMVRSPWIVDANHMLDLRTGRLLPVKIDSRNGKVIFPNVAWAIYDWRRESEILPIPEEAAEVLQ